jgi:hypothetical protein
VALRRARIPSRAALNGILVRVRHAGSLLRRDNSGSFRADVRLLAELLLKGGILLVVADAAGAPVARVLIQPDADILMSINLRGLPDSTLGMRIHDAQQLISARLASASRSLDAVSTATHAAFAAAYVAIARQMTANLRLWLVQTVLATGIVMLGALAASIVRRVLLRWLLRHL